MTNRPSEQEAPSASEVRLRLATARAGVGLWEVDAREGRWRLSAEAMALLGVERAELRREELLAAIHPADRAAADRQWNLAADQGGAYEAEFRTTAHAADGGEHWLLARGHVERDAKGRLTQHAGVLLDVTARRRAEAALRDREARLRLALEAAGLGSWEVDLRTGLMSRAGRVVTPRPDLPLAGYTLDEYLRHVVHPDDIARVRNTFDELTTGHVTSYRMEYRVRRSGDDGWLWMESYGGIVETDQATGAALRAAGTSRDVTERRDAEALLRASEERFRFALEAAGGVGTWDWQVKANRIVADAAVGALFGVDPARAEQGAPVADYVAGIHPGDRERVQAAIRKACRADSTGEYAIEYRVTGIDGVLRWVLARGRCYHDDAGKPVRFPGVVVDITARKESEERQALLAQEVDHRAKNVLAVAQSVVWLTRTEDPHAFREAVTGRITAMARAHTLLASENWNGARLRMLVEAELAAYRRVASDPTPERVTLTGARVDILPVAVQPLAMTLHELTTNAVKHGALSVIGGRLDVTWMPAQAGGLRLQWVERGGPRPAGEPGRRGFGTSLVEATVNRQLGGRLRLEWNVEGLTVDLTLPATRVRWHGAPPAT